MKMPNADQAIITEAKLRDYLLNPDHRRGGSKARLLHIFGYDRADWSRLGADIRTHHLDRKVDRATENDFGRRYEIVGPIITPCGRPLIIRTVWQIDRGTTVPRLITMRPEWLP